MTVPSQSTTSMTPEERRALLAQMLREKARVQQTDDRHIGRRPEGSAPLLSFSQQRLWFFDQMMPGSSVYNLAASVYFKGMLDRSALQQALTMIVHRHEALRTTFGTEEGRPVARITPPAPAAVQIVELQTMAEAYRDAELQRLILEEKQRPFDLAHGPLYRIVLFCSSSEEYVLLMTIHHIVSDGWSMGVLVREFQSFYNAFASGQAPPKLELPIQYADFAYWQRQQLQGVELERLQNYWKQQLGGASHALDLPTDFPRPAVQTFRGAQQTLVLKEGLVEQIKALSRTKEATPFMTLLAAFSVLLARHSGQEDIVIGSPSAGRTRMETEGLIGFFINQLALRVNLSGNPSFNELLRQVHGTALGAYEHQDLPFDKIIEELKPRRDPSRSPLFQVQFNMLPRLEKHIQLYRLAAEGIPLPEIEAKYDLSLYIYNTDTDYDVHLVYNTDLFSDERMHQLLVQYHYLLEQITQQPELPIGAFSLVNPLAGTHLPDPTAAFAVTWHGGVLQQFTRQVQLVPDQAALIDSATSWTYRELNLYAERLAGTLQAQGVGKKDVVAVYAHRSALLVVALLGIVKTGAAFVILDPQYPATRLGEGLKLCQPKAWLEIEHAGSPSQQVLDVLDELGCGIRHTLSKQGVEAETGSSAFGYTPVPIAPDDLAYIAFTSGSTGHPKAILGTHRPLDHFVHWHINTFGMHREDRFSMLSGLAHDPLLRDIFTPLALGATLCIPHPELYDQPDMFRSWMQKQAISVAHVTPALGQLLAAPKESNRSPLRYIFCGGDMLTNHQVAQLRTLNPHVTCVNFYGATETPQAMGYYVVPDASDDATLNGARVPVGRGIDGVQLLVLNASQQLAAVGELGEICIRTPYLAQGYLGDNSLTAERFITNPYTRVVEDRLYRTGDLGRYLPDGSVLISGRNDQQVKIRGFRIELGEIEAVLRAHPGVGEGVVVDREVRNADRQLIAYITSADERSPSSSDLRRHLRGRLPDYMIPALFVALDAIPLTPNGKIDRRALPLPEHERTGAGSQFVAPVSEMEQTVAQIWSNALGTARVSLHDNFFDLGGHSLLAVETMAHIEKQTGIKLSPAVIRTQTLGQLATMIEQQQHTLQPPQSVEAEQPFERKPGLFKRILGNRKP